MQNQPFSSALSLLGFVMPNSEGSGHLPTYRLLEPIPHVLPDAGAVLVVESQTIFPNHDRCLLLSWEAPMIGKRYYQVTLLNVYEKVD